MNQNDDPTRDIEHLQATDPLPAPAPDRADALATWRDGLEALPLKRRAFAYHYAGAAAFNATRAALLAGYAPAAAYATGAELLREPQVMELVAFLAHERLRAASITAQDVIGALITEATRTGPGTSHSARVQALTTLARHFSLLNDRVTVEAGATFVLERSDGSSMTYAVEPSPASLEPSHASARLPEPDRDHQGEPSTS
tara:strand:- start:106 stop:705 length:600 start_codon:yes stop_codon:yes gene_type:complete